MSEHVRRNQEREEFSLGMAFMGLLMAISALYGIWMLPVLIKMLAKMIS